jgi:hypothetical protein
MVTSLLGIKGSRYTVKNQVKMACRIKHLFTNHKFKNRENRYAEQGLCPREDKLVRHKAGARVCGHTTPNALKLRS